jgi:S-adenosylmethionine hydrolase
MGRPFTDPVLLSLLKPQKTANGFTAHITVVDVFGNLTTDLPASEIIDKDITINFKGREINGIAPSYGHRQSDEIIALVDSEDFLEIAVVNGSAAKVTGGKVGDAVEVIIN